MGVPLRVEIGQKDMEKGQVCLVRRDTGEKSFVPEANFEAEVERLMAEIQKNLYAQAKEILRGKTFPAKDFAEFVDVIKEKHGMAEVAWCGAQECEDKFKAEVGATIRCLRDGQPSCPCVVCGKPAVRQIALDLFGRHILVFELTSVLLLTKKLYIIGPCVIAQKDAAEGILAISPEGDVTLSHVTLSGGSGDPGIAVRNEGRLVMTRCSLLRNSAAFGGGSVCNRGTMTMEGCAIAWNSGDLSGRGILNYGTLTFSGCVLQENVSRPGGDAEPGTPRRTGVPGGDSPRITVSRGLRSSKRRLTLTRCQGVSFSQMMMRSGSGTQAL